AEVRMRAVGQADGCGSARDFLHCDAMFDIAESGAAILFFHGDAVQAERAELGPEIPWKLVAAVDFGSARGDLMGGEIMNGLSQRIRGFAEIEIEAPIRIGNHGWGASVKIIGSFTALVLAARLVTRHKAPGSGLYGVPAAGRWTDENGSKLALALTPARGCNSRWKHHPPDD